jgi:hypothetical protein
MIALAPVPGAARARAFEAPVVQAVEIGEDAVRERSPVDLPEHDVERAEDGGDVGQHVALVHEVHRLQMREARRADLAAIGLVGAVGTR